MKWKWKWNGTWLDVRYKKKSIHILEEINKSEQQFRAWKEKEKGHRAMC